MKTTHTDADQPLEFSATALIALAPILRTHAQRLLRSNTSADDAVQDTLERAWGARNTFRSGAELKPWIFQILRNVIIDRLRQSWRLAPDVGDVEARRLASPPNQLWNLYYADTIAALEILSANQKQALLLVALGATTVEAAATMGCPLGTLKSHLRLARGKLKAAGV